MHISDATLDPTLLFPKKISLVISVDEFAILLRRRAAMEKQEKNSVSLSEVVRAIIRDSK